MAEEASQPTPTETPPPQQDGPASDDAILSELASLSEDGDDPAPQPEPQQETPAAEQGQGEGEEPTQEAEPEASTEEPQKEPESGAEPEQDAETQRRIEAIQRRERQAKEAIAQERQQLEQEREKAKPLIEQAQRIQELRRKADPVGILREYGYSDDDMEAIARAAYYASPKAKQDPAAREAAERELRQRHQGSELEELRAEVKRMREEQQQREVQARQQQQVAQYLESVTSAVGEETPLIKTWMGKDAKEVRDALAQTAYELGQEYGEVPDPADVAKQLEKNHRAKLEKLGIDPATVLAPKSEPEKPKTQNQTAGETKTAKSLSPDMGTPTEPRSEPASEEELDQEILRGLQTGKFE